MLLFFNPLYGLVLRCCLWPLIRKWNLMKLCLIDLHNPMTIDMALFCNGLPLRLAPRWCWYCYQESFIPFPPHFQKPWLLKLLLPLLLTGMVIFEGEGLSVINVIPRILSMILYDVVSLDYSFACIFSWLSQNL